MPRRILLVDDDPAIRELLRQVLEEAGYKVVDAGEGKEAIRVARTLHFDLLITDLVMPGREGIELIQHFRQSYSDVKIIAMSGAASGQYLRIANALGADAVLEKPFAMDALVAMVIRLLPPDEIQDRAS